MIGEPRPFTPPESDTLYADVIVPRHLARPFTYTVPFHLRTVLRVGHVVFVPFGRSLVQGAVVALTGAHPPELDRHRLKEIRALVTASHSTEIPPALFQLARLVADTYVAPWGQCLRLVVPPRAVTADRSRIVLTKKGHEAIAMKESVSPVMLQLLKRLKRRPLGIPLSRLSIECPDEVLTGILDRAWAEKLPGRATVSARSSESALTASSADLLHVHDDDSKGDGDASSLREWEARVGQELEKRHAVRLLVEAAPGERLALLRHAVARTVALGRSVLVITGETARAESLAQVLDDRLMAPICLHGAMAQGRRADIWNRIRMDQVSVVVGTRSAVFLPLHSIGLIWIDREEDPTLKEPMEPRYHVRALFRSTELWCQ